MDTETRLRKLLTEVRIAPQYEAAVEAGVMAAIKLWPDSNPGMQNETARRVALRELAARLGWMN